VNGSVTMNSPAPPPVDLGNLASLADATATNADAALGAGIAPLETTTSARGSARKRGLALANALPFVAAIGGVSWLLLDVLPKAAVRRRRRARFLGSSIGLGVGAAIVGVARWQMERLFTPEPPYEVEGRRGPLELRRYPAMQIAETVLDEHWEEALEDGFERLAAFIFGENREARKVSMTTPVLGSGDVRGFHVAFIVPEGITPPEPVDPRIRVKTLASRRVAVLRFAGRRDAETIRARKEELAHALVLHGLRPRGEATFAGYDPPWTLPLLRRNELWVELEDAAFGADA